VKTRVKREKIDKIKKRCNKKSREINKRSKILKRKLLRTPTIKNGEANMHKQNCRGKHYQLATYTNL
jgi:hypothetical protein